MPDFNRNKNKFKFIPLYEYIFSYLPTQHYLNSENNVFAITIYYSLMVSPYLKNFHCRKYSDIKIPLHSVFHCNFNSEN